MKLTRETEYALSGLTALARRGEGAMVPLAELAEAESLPASFLAKIFQKLVRHGILLSTRGAGNGYSLAVAPEALSVLRVIEAVEGSDYLDRCLFWGGHCGGENPCQLHDFWVQVKPRVRAMLEETTVEQLAGSGIGATGSGISAKGGGA